MMDKQKEMRGLIILQTILSTALSQAKQLEETSDFYIWNTATELVDCLEIQLAKIGVQLTELEREGYTNPYL